MFMSKRETKKNEEVLTSAFNLISQGTEIIGDIKCKGDIRMDGIIKGNIHSKAKVVIGASGSIDGAVTCQNADVSGNLKGSIEVGESLYLKASAMVIGEIVTGKLIVEAGAVFNGNCQMGGIGDKPEKAGKAKGKEGESTTSKETLLA